ncbi:MAG: hypothetical protein GX334_02100 [Firmicutes bacterium]|nr:hypothetical protein [Bacillota bacterium]
MQAKGLFRENILLEVFDHESGIYYKSLIQEVNETDIAVGIPMKEGKQLLLRYAERYFFRIFLVDALYSFHSTVLGEKSCGQVSLYLLSWPDKIERSQRRRYYRFVYTFDADYWVLNGDSPTSLESQVADQEPLPAVVVNLSGGGLAFVTEKRFSPETLLALRFYLQNDWQEDQEVLLKGRITRVEPLKHGKIRYYRYGVEFLELDERTRDEIIRFIFFMFRQRLR